MRLNDEEIQLIEWISRQGAEHTFPEPFGRLSQLVCAFRHVPPERFQILLRALGRKGMVQVRVRAFEGSKRTTDPTFVPGYSRWFVPGDSAGRGKLRRRWDWLLQRALDLARPSIEPSDAFHEADELRSELLEDGDDPARWQMIPLGTGFVAAQAAAADIHIRITEAARDELALHALVRDSTGATSALV